MLGQAKDLTQEYEKGTRTLTVTLAEHILGYNHLAEVVMNGGTQAIAACGQVSAFAQKQHSMSSSEWKILQERCEDDVAHYEARLENYLNENFGKNFPGWLHYSQWSSDEGSGICFTNVNDSRYYMESDNPNSKFNREQLVVYRKDFLAGYSWMWLLEPVEVEGVWHWRIKSPRHKGFVSAVYYKTIEPGFVPMPIKRWDTFVVDAQTPSPSADDTIWRGDLWQITKKLDNQLKFEIKDQDGSLRCLRPDLNRVRPLATNDSKSALWEIKPSK